MANVKISELTAIAAVEANDLFEVSEDTGGGTFSSKKATATQVKSFAVGSANVSFTGPTAARTFTLPDSNATIAILGANTFSANQTLADNQIIRPIIKDGAVAYFNSGTTNALDYTNGSHQRWAPNTGAQTLSITNWPPTGNLGELLIEGVNLGAATITWPTINWIKSDGTTTTTFSSNGVTLQSSGIDWVLLWTRDAGSTIYGKIVR